jgi:hypothetical protein
MNQIDEYPVNSSQSIAQLTKKKRNQQQWQPHQKQQEVDKERYIRKVRYFVLSDSFSLRKNSISYIFGSRSSITNVIFDPKVAVGTSRIVTCCQNDTTWQRKNVTSLKQDQTVKEKCLEFNNFFSSMTKCNHWWKWYSFYGSRKYWTDSISLITKHINISEMSNFASFSLILIKSDHVYIWESE